MLITLAYPYEGHKPDETIEVDNATGSVLIYEGRARPADNLDAMKVPDLRDYAEANDIDLGGARSKADILAAIQAAEQTHAPTTSPASGATDEGTT